MPLSDVAVRNAKGREKPYKLSDSDGLYVFVKPNGSRLWRIDYQFDGKRKTLSIGQYPVVGLADARSKCVETRNLLKAGTDPALKKKFDTIQAAVRAQTTFGAVAEQYLAKLADDGVAAVTLTKNRWLLLDLTGSIKDRPIDDIKPVEILHVLKPIEKSGRLETARRLRAAMSRVFRYAIPLMMVETDPCEPLRGALKAVKVVNQAAITSEKEFGALMAVVDDYDGWPTIVGAIQFTALTACRPGEVRGATWSEIDMEAACWTVPAARTKMRREHKVPLSRQALAVLRRMKAVTGGEWPLVFPSVRSNKKMLSENAMNAALRRMGFTKTEHTSHGFRSSFSTIMNARQHDPEIIEHALAHADGSVRGIYNRTTFWPARVDLMQAWADLIDELKNPGAR